MSVPYGPPPSPKPWRVGFEIGLLIMIALIGLSAKQIFDYSNFVQSQIAHDQIVSESQRLEVSLREAHSAYSLYLRQGGEKNVKVYNEALGQYGTNYQRLKEALEKNKSNSLSLNELVAASNRLFDRMNVHFKMKMTGRGSEANALMNSPEEQETLSAALDAFRKFRETTDSLPVTQFQDLKERAQWILLTLVIGTLLALGLLLWTRSVSSRESQSFKTLSQILAAGQEELVEAHQRVKALSQAKSDFLSNMSHEVRTPLNAITGLSHILLRTVRGKEEVELIQGIQKSAKSLLDVINPILDYSKIEHEGLELHLDPSVDLGRLANEAVDIMSGQAKLKGIELKTSIEGNLRYVETDRVRLKQVFLNLIGNAVKFTTKGSVTLKLKVLSDPRSQSLNCRFEIIDTGVGIPDEAKSRLFQSFAQSDSSISRQYGGTGLGLSISKQIVSKMNGQIGFESQYGVGTTFWFEIPFAVASASPVPEQPEVQEPIRRAYSHVRTLVVEDNPMNQFVLKSFLDEFGCIPEMVASAHEALELVDNNAYDLIFLDVQMPGMDGFTATQHIRKIEFEKRRKSFIVATTAHAMSGYRDKCIAGGMDDYLPKPVSIGNLQKIFQVHFEAGHVDASGPRIQSTAEDILASVKNQSSPGSQEIPHVNQKRWDKLGSPKFRREMITLYEASTPKRFEELIGAIANLEYSVIEDAAHFLKSSTGALGFEKLTDILDRIEELASNKKASEEFVAPLQQLRAEMVHVAEFIKRAA